MSPGRIVATPIGIYYTDTGKYSTRKIHTKLQRGPLWRIFRTPH